MTQQPEGGIWRTHHSDKVEQSHVRFLRHSASSLGVDSKKTTLVAAARATMITEVKNTESTRTTSSMLFLCCGGCRFVHGKGASIRKEEELTFLSKRDLDYEDDKTRRSINVQRSTELIVLPVFDSESILGVTRAEGWFQATIRKYQLR